jgi:hypothetical protein
VNVPSFSRLGLAGNMTSANWHVPVERIRRVNLVWLDCIADCAWKIWASPQAALPITVGPIKAADLLAASDLLTLSSGATAPGMRSNTCLRSRYRVRLAAIAVKIDLKRLSIFFIPKNLSWTGVILASHPTRVSHPTIIKIFLRSLE